MDTDTVSITKDQRLPLGLLSILTLTLCAFSVTTAEFVIAGILPQVAAGLGVSVPAAGHLVTAYAIGMIVGGPLVTLLTVSVPRKPLMVALLLVFAAGNAFAAIAPTYSSLLAARLLGGSVVGTFFALAIVVAASLAAPGKQASAIAKVAFGFNLAMILGAPLGTLIGQQFGWRSTFIAIAILAAIAVAFLIKLVPVRRTNTPGSIARELRVLKNRDLQLALATTAVGNAGVLMAFVYLAPLLTNISGFSHESVPALLLLYGVGATLGNLVGGWLSDRALMPSMIGLLFGLAVALALFWLIGAIQFAALLMIFVIGALAFAIIPGMQTKVLIAAQEAPTLGIAINASGFQAAAALAAWTGGEIIKGSMGLPSLPLIGAVVTVAGAILAIMLLRRRGG
ncbi:MULTISPECIES: MFS transporter [unclassified Shinella]|uniref:MFS transporter n=1 Tax=unclassified Shinella TaxID=2643062 RepID=UPI00225CE37A|nr:MFS transporter [Shinella sp. YE25]MDC7259449.1 MFS transporter [Shinella sp. YE25]CAI0341203.1 MFS transporter [Rhizobiaceae bacterium]CAK7260844.1 MFS transporter, DHA1 family, inner membrane transport protein [Shinella sp. WSC3-e]